MQHLATTTPLPPMPVQVSQVRIITRKGQLIAQERSSDVVQNQWLRIPIHTAEQILLERARKSMPDVELKKRQARMGFAPDMVRVPYVVRMHHLCGRVTYGINFLAEGLKAGYPFTPIHGGSAVVVEAL